METLIGLSKSKYCKGVQCPKILWMDINKPNEAEAVLPNGVLDNGNAVGDLARSYFGEYKLVEYDRNKSVMIAQTEKYITEGADNIAEASFCVDGLYCAVDILHKDEDGWDIVEVKSSTKVSEIYEEDMSFQLYVLRKCGINVKKVLNMHINSAYTYHDKLDIKSLFALEDYSKKCFSKEGHVEERIKSIREYMKAKEEPEQEITLHCESPYECAYKNYCWKNIPEKSIFDIRRLNASTKYDLYHQGIISYEDIIKKNPKINANQKRQVETSYYHIPDYCDKAAIRKFLDTLTYPVYHLDFETFQLAIPQFEGCSPYQQIPFQYSLHVEYEDGRLEHREFLAKEGTDPRRALAEQLCKDIPEGVCSLAYNMAFERTVILELSNQFPDLQNHLLDIRDNMHDLMIPFQKQYYYTEAMQGSYSIKYVLPALWPNDPELNYHNLDQVHNGAEASNAFAVMSSLPQDEIMQLRQNLLKYCGLDTFAMVKVLQKLREVAS